jgi:microcystin-dependent protein
MDLRGAIDLHRNSHDRSDVDQLPTSLHHTLGTGANQAASGNHTHPGSGGSGEGAVVGDIKIAAYAGDSGNWFSCDGRALSRVIYSVLFARISTLWGIGDGSTTFNIPNPAGRAVVGAGTGAGLTARAFASTFGSENSVVVSHSHSHGHNHAHVINIANDSPDHAHNFNATNISWAGTGSGSVTRLANQGVGAGTSGATARHGHPGSSSNADATVDATVAGVSGTGANMPPGLAFNLLIKVL